jgi:hypothetical protein
MLFHAKNYFRNCRLARMSNGEYCLIRDQGLVKGGRGLKHHETLITFSIRGIVAKFRQLRHANGTGERDSLSGRGDEIGALDPVRDRRLPQSERTAIFGPGAHSPLFVAGSGNNRPGQRPPALSDGKIVAR